MVRVLFFVCFLVPLKGAFAAADKLSPAAFFLLQKDTIADLILADVYVEFASEVDTLTHRKENKKLISAILTVALGPFGAHRVYLGTSHLIPIAYVLTLGGGLGLVPVIDLLVITFSKDISPYENNKRFFMWIR